MRTRFIEAVSVFEGAYGNHGKFMLGHFDPEEWGRRSVIEPAVDDWRGDIVGRGQLLQRGWGREHALVFDLQTGEGALFRIGGHAHADLEKHKIWVCPLFEPTLEWLSANYRSFAEQARVLGAGIEHWIAQLPDVIEISQPVEWAGYRRPGPDA